MHMGRHRNLRRSEKKITCQVKRCVEESTRSLPYKKVKSYISDGFKEGVGRRVHLCKVHYKEYKKGSKTDRQIERLGRHDGGMGPF